MYLVTVHAAFGISTRVKYAVSGRRVEGNMRPLRVVKADPVVDDFFEELCVMSWFSDFRGLGGIDWPVVLPADA